MKDLVAYIDAGTGSYLLAAIASGAAGVWFFIRSSFAKMRGRSLDSSVPEVDEIDEIDELEATVSEPESSTRNA